MTEQQAVSNYYKKVRGNPPRPTTVFGLERAASQGILAADVAIDLGCGEGRDLAAMLKHPWTVWAYDIQPEAVELVQSRFPGENHSRLHVERGDLATLKLPMNHFVNASFSLPFVAQSEFFATWASIESSLKPGGHFAGQLFGEREEGWDYLEKFSRVEKNRLPELFANFDILHLDEIDGPGVDASGHKKYWHVFNIVARKK
jgi:SAM-dependent methyltransferase